MIALIGAHRAGKSTLAKTVAEKTGFTYWDAATSATMRERGYNTVGEMTFEKRLEMQEIMLDLYAERLQIAPRRAITDRSPLDMAAYTLAELGMYSGLEKSELGDRTMKYVERCVSLTSQSFQILLLLRPLPDYVVDPKSPAPNRPYQWHIHYLIAGLMRDMPEQVSMGEVTTFDMGERTVAVTQLIHDYVVQLKHNLSQLTVH